jgi:predicted KAP-like P-loop ATPase
MWSDNETDVDLLDYSHLVDAVTTIVANDRLVPSTIGVFGDWGSGKSSLLQMIKLEVEKGEDVLCLSFNGWIFEGYEDAKSALMGTILDEISEKRTLVGKGKELAKKLFKRVDILKTVGFAGKHALAFAVAGPAGLGITAGMDAINWLKQIAEKGSEADVEKIKTFLHEAPSDSAEIRRTVIEFRKDFADLLKETKIRRLVVIIDDLDRCNPDTIIATLEAIKLFLFVPQTVFLIGADERLVKYAVRRRFPELPGDYAEVGRDYLEKLVQFPVRVPPLGRAETETYINLLFANLGQLTQDQCEKARVHAMRKTSEQIHDVTFNRRIAQELFGELPNDLVEGLSLAEQLSRVLTVGLNGNPRQCKRFLNMLLMRIRMAKSRNIILQKGVLAKLMLLEYFRPEFFKSLAAMQVEENGKPKLLQQAEAFFQPEPRIPAPQPASSDGDFAAPKKGARKAAEISQKTPPDDPRVTPWLADAWMQDWLRGTPPLRDADLGPYFFFSRDILGPLGIAVQRLTPAAQEVLQKLLNESEAAQKLGVQQAKDLNQAEAAAVFEALADKVQREEDLTDAGSSLPTLFDFVKVRLELSGQLISALGRIPDGSVPVNVPMRLQSIGFASEVGIPLQQLLQRWKTGPNKRLAAGVDNALKRIRGPVKG